ncbi:MAG: hypothetical protein PHI93_04845 [Kiritimatiellae bacterium]|jgi:DNA-directed RNA polymerase subunit RPC12/RpoP|nr:hypothetical protein [Kiritimatiellia bacterium]
MTAKNKVIHKEMKQAINPNETESEKQTAPAQTTDAPAKIDIGLERVLPAALAAQPGSTKATDGEKTKPSIPAPSDPSGPEVERPSQSNVADSKPSGKARDFKFLCTSCGKKLKVSENATGQTINCPDCGNEITIPQPTVEPQTSKQLERGVRYKKPEVFKFYCVRCGKKLEADRDQAGTQIGCPQCKSAITVPQPADA